MKKIKLLLGILLLLILAVSCGNKTNAGRKRVIKVGTDGVYAPFSFFKNLINFLLFCNFLLAEPPIYFSI